MVEVIEPVDWVCGLQLAFEQHVLKQKKIRLHRKNFVLFYT